MKYETLPNNLQLPKIGYGTWKVGGGMSPDYSQDARALTAIRTALELGYTHIDTAEIYARGHTEELTARAIQESGIPRENLFITTKVSPARLRYRSVLRACEGSLRRLGTEYIDLYLIHWPNPLIPLKSTFKALNELAARGKVRHVGVSNFNLGQLKKAQSLSNTPIVTNQVPYSLHKRQYADNGVLEYCQENDILLTAYTPVERGQVGSDPVVREIAAKHNADPVQVALAWLIQQPRVVTIPMSMNPKHIAENLHAVDIELDEEDIRQMFNRG